MDMTCRCVPANTASFARTIAGVQSNYNSLAGRVTDLETAVTEINATLDSLVAGGDSMFTIVDTEAELTAALAAGKIILIRGLGTEGEVRITSPKTISVPGTKIFGVGYYANGVYHKGKIKADWAARPVYGSQFAPIMFSIQCSDVEIGYLDIEGTDANDTNYMSYVAFYLSTTTAIQNIHIHHNTMWNLCNALTKWGFSGAPATTNLNFEHNTVYSTTGPAISLLQSVYKSFFHRNIITPRLNGDPETFTAANGITVSADIQDCEFTYNVITNCPRIGLECTSVAWTPTVFAPMRRNRYIGNTIRNCSSMGMSIAYCSETDVFYNIVEDVTQIGIEVAGGASLGESSGTTTCRVEHNQVRRVTGTTYVSGIILDQTVESTAKHNLVKDVTTDFSGVGEHIYARGIDLYRSKDAVVKSNELVDIDGTAILLQNGGVAESLARAVVESNDVKVSAPYTKSKYAVLIQGGVAVVRNNTAWEPASQVAQAKYYCENNGAAVVKPGAQWTADIVANGFFQETNLVITF
jgi:hypothetical protein